MPGTSNDIERINLEYFDQAFRQRSAIIALIQSWISFDQQSKSKRNWSLIKSLLRKGGCTQKDIRILDYGCGRGSLLFKLPRRAKLTACDISTQALSNIERIANLLHRQVDLVTPTAFLDNGPERRFDIILCSHVLEHVPSDQHLLMSLVGRLRESGKIVLNLPINEVWEDPKHIRKYTTQTACRLLEECGLHVEQSYEADKWSAYFLSREKVRMLSVGTRGVLRLFRAALALLPTRLTESLEGVFLPRYHYQQLIIIASRNE
jgi:2-polyprenyl-3-methyl-5-hydroxy-6-metoxy-1,4-benzoquinol methylase